MSRQYIHIFLLLLHLFLQHILLSSILILYVNHHYKLRAQLIILYKATFNLCFYLREL